MPASFKISLVQGLTAVPSFNRACLLRPWVGFVFQGPIPGSLSQLDSLQELWLNGNRLTGRIPPELGQLGQLRELYLNANELVGPIPQSFSALTNLEGLNLSWNQLTGGFPSCLGNMVRKTQQRNADSCTMYVASFVVLAVFKMRPIDLD